MLILLEFQYLLLYLPHNFEAIHNKDYSVVKTLGSLVLERGIFFVVW